MFKSKLVSYEERSFEVSTKNNYQEDSSIYNDSDIIPESTGGFLAHLQQQWTNSIDDGGREWHSS